MSSCVTKTFDPFREAILQVLFILEREIIKENKVNMIHFVTYLITQSSGFKCSSCN